MSDTPMTMKELEAVMARMMSSLAKTSDVVKTANIVKAQITHVNKNVDKLAGMVDDVAKRIDTLDRPAGSVEAKMGNLKGELEAEWKTRRFDDIAHPHPHGHHRRPHPRLRVFRMGFETHPLQILESMGQHREHQATARRRRGATSGTSGRIATGTST